MGIRIGKYTLASSGDGKVWISNYGEEAGQFSEKDLEAAIEKFFSDNF